MGGKPTIPVVAQPRDKVVIVTGGNAGIGYETAKFIAMMGAEVIIACRSEEKAKEAIERMNVEFEEEKKLKTENIISDSRLNVTFMRLDLASLKSTKQFVTDFQATGKQLHILICNAGVFMPSQVMTEDNFELTYQVNYLSHFMIVACFLPIMKNSGDDSRIILVSSVAHRRAKFSLDYASGKAPKEYNNIQCYTNTKLFQIMQMYIIDRLIIDSHVEISCVHPGLVETDLFKRNERELPCLLKFVLCCGNCTGAMKSPHQGAASSIYVAVDPDLKGASRGFYEEARVAPEFPSKTSRDRDLQDFLLYHTIQILKDYLPEDFVNQASETIQTKIENDSFRAKEK